MKRQRVGSGNIRQSRSGYAASGLRSCGNWVGVRRVSDGGGWTFRKSGQRQRGNE